MDLAQQVVADLEVDEGWREYPYKDHLGFVTIGYGFLIDERKPVRLPKVVGEFWLRYLVSELDEALDKAFPWYARQPVEVQRALINMSYQMGIAGLCKFKNMLAALEKGDRQLAAQEAAFSTWYGQTPVRAKRVVRMIRGH